MIRMPKAIIGTRRYRDFWSLVLPAVAILVVAFWIAFQFVQPAPPRKVVMAGGAEGGAYEDYAIQYRDAH